MGFKGGLCTSAVWRRRNQHVGVQFVRALVTGVLATVVDVLIMVALVTGLGWHYLAGNAVSYTVGASLNYLLSIHWVFSSRNISRPLVEFGVFLALGMLGLGVSQLSMLIFVEGLGLHYTLAKVAATLCHFGFNFWSRKSFLFRNEGPSVDSSAGRQQSEGETI